MKTFALSALILGVALFSGCSWFHHSNHGTAAVKAKKAKPAVAAVVTPDLNLAAKVVMYNEVGRFVILNFPPEQMPKSGQIMAIYHAGLKVAQVKVSGSDSAGTLDKDNNNIVADVVTGVPQIGDIVRAE